MIRCAVLDDYQNVAMTSADWSPLDGRVAIDCFHEPILNAERLVATLLPYDIVVAMRERTAFSREILSRLPNLRLLVTTGAKNAAIDLAAAKENGTIVCGTGSDLHSTVELTWALLLGVVRHIPHEVAGLRNGSWQTTIGSTLKGKQLGVLGLGRIGSEVARIGAAFGMKVLAWSPNLTSERCEKIDVALAASKEDLFRSADVLTIHMVLGERSAGIVGEAELRLMKASAYLINTARAGLVEERALVRALDEHWIAGAALDVFYQEPLAPDSVFRRLPNLVGTPHLGYVSRDGYAIYYSGVVEDIAAWLDGSPVRVLG